METGCAIDGGGGKSRQIFEGKDGVQAGIGNPSVALQYSDVLIREVNKMVIENEENVKMKDEINKYYQMIHY